MFQFNSHSRRLFSTFSRVVGNSIEISSHMPPKIRIPVAHNQAYDVTLNREETVDQFEQKVKETCGATQFKIIADNQAATTLGDILKRKFAIQVNSKKYEVYPQLETMIERGPVSQ